jgi:iron(II)-dependent oxidoreductase
MTECRFSPGPDAAHTAIIEALARVRGRTVDLVAPIFDDGLTRQHSPLVSPIVWNLGHIAARGESR